MSSEVKGDTKLNWMLRLPQSAQLVGIVQVEGRRVSERSGDDGGLIAAADREGFITNEAFSQLEDIVRGAVEAIAYSDRRLQLEEIEAERNKRLESIRDETQAAIDEIESSPTIAPGEKNRLLDAIARTQYLVERQEESARERERQLEVMSLLGVVAGFMTHEFGAAIQDLKEAQADIHNVLDRMPQLAHVEKSLTQRIKNLTEFTAYAQGYVAGSQGYARGTVPCAIQDYNAYKRVFGQYAAERNIDVEITVARDLQAPLVPLSLYNGISL